MKTYLLQTSDGKFYRELVSCKEELVKLPYWNKVSYYTQES